MSKQTRKSIGWWAFYLCDWAFIAGVGCEMREHKFMMADDEALSAQ